MVRILDLSGINRYYPYVSAFFFKNFWFSKKIRLWRISGSGVTNLASISPYDVWSIYNKIYHKNVNFSHYNEVGHVHVQIPLPILRYLPIKQILE